MTKELDNDTIDLIAERFKVLSDATRLKILNSLRGGKKTVTQLVEATGAGQANVSKHLGLLFNHALVNRQKDGLNVYYFISDPTIFDLCELVCNGLEMALETQRQVLLKRRSG